MGAALVTATGSLRGMGGRSQQRLFNSAGARVFPKPFLLRHPGSGRLNVATMHAPLARLFSIELGLSLSPPPVRLRDVVGYWSPVTAALVKPPTGLHCLKKRAVLLSANM